MADLTKYNSLLAWFTMAESVVNLTRETVDDPATFNITVKAIDTNKNEKFELSDEKIKKRIKEINFPSFLLNDELVDFYYNDTLKADAEKKSVSSSIYMKTLQKKMADAMGLRSVIKRFEQLIILNDGNPEDPDIRNNLPRKKKLERISQFYEFLIDFSLSLINNFYWCDDNGVEQSFWTLEQCIDQALPMILDLKNKLEKFAEEELKRN